MKTSKIYGIKVPCFIYGTTSTGEELVKFVTCTKNLYEELVNFVCDVCSENSRSFFLTG